MTTQAGLLDSDGRRVTIQDASAAVLLRLPSGSQAPSVGRRLRVTGEIGTYYGAPQLEAADAPQDLGREGGSPIVLHRAPVASDEWRLVRVTVRITNVSRSGDTWRAEASMGAGGSLPISGIAASRLPSTALDEGRGATITGIVKRAYPTASDQRFSVVPRGPSDIQLAADPARHPLRARPRRRHEPVRRRRPACLRQPHGGWPHRVRQWKPERKRRSRWISRCLWSACCPVWRR